MVNSAIVSPDAMSEIGRLEIGELETISDWGKGENEASPSEVFAAFQCKQLQ